MEVMWENKDSRNHRKQWTQEAHPHNSGQECKSALTASNLDDEGSAGEAGAFHHGAKHTAAQDSETLKEGRGEVQQWKARHTKGLPQEISNSKP